MNKNEKVCAIVAAAGSGTRMKTNKNKLYELINNKEVIAHSLIALEKTKLIDEIIIVTKKEEFKNMKKICEDNNISKLKDIIEGGETRTISVKNGLLKTNADFVAIHDGARPLVKICDIENVIKKAFETNGAILGVVATDTIKLSDENQNVSKTLNRDLIWQIQTPQVFNRNLLLKAYEENKTTETDDSSLIEKTGVKVSLVLGSKTNIKITTKEDLLFASAYIKEV